MCSPVLLVIENRVLAVRVAVTVPGPDVSPLVGLVQVYKLGNYPTLGRR